MKKLILTLMIVGVSIKSYSCDCKKYSLEDGYKWADIIVSGKVLTLDTLTLNLPKSYIDSLQKKNDELYFPNQKIYEYTVLVTKSYKGQITNNTMKIRTGPSNCRLILEVGKSYIIFASEIKYMHRVYDLSLKENTFQSTQCSKTALYSWSLNRQVESLKKKLAVATPLN